MGTQIGSGLHWRVVNGTDVYEARYSVFRDTDMFPVNLNVNPPLDGVIAVVVSAVSSPNGTSTINITSVLNVSDVSILNVTSLQCVTPAGTETSNVLNVSLSMLIDLNAQYRIELNICH